MNQTLTVLVGPPCSGKTTLTRTFPQSTYVVSRDTERLALFGEYRMGNRTEEAIVTDLCHYKTMLLLSNGYDVILDNTHCDMRYIKLAVAQYNRYVDVAIHFMDDVPLEELKSRNAIRFAREDKHIPEDVIKNMYVRFNALKAEYEDNEFPKFFPKDVVGEL